MYMFQLGNLFPAVTPPLILFSWALFSDFVMDLQIFKFLSLQAGSQFARNFSKLFGASFPILLTPSLGNKEEWACDMLFSMRLPDPEGPQPRPPGVSPGSFRVSEA